MTFSLYVTGTDTGIGKTLASAALLHALRGHGLRAAGMKPVASGCERIDGQWRNSDALALQAAGEPGIAYADINPFALEHPLAPELAARDAGVEVALPPLLAAHARLVDRFDAVVVEGVGGDDEGGVEGIVGQEFGQVGLVGRGRQACFREDFDSFGIGGSRRFADGGNGGAILLLQHLADVVAGHAAAADEGDAGGVGHGVGVVRGWKCS